MYCVSVTFTCGTNYTLAASASSTQHPPNIPTVSEINDVCYIDLTTEPYLLILHRRIFDELLEAFQQQIFKIQNIKIEMRLQKFRH